MAIDPIIATHWAGAAAFAVGTVITVAFLLSLDSGAVRSQVAYLLIIPAFAGLSYVFLALGVGTVPVNGTEFFGFRYIDWIVTTPLLVGYVGYVAGASRTAIAGVMIGDALMIAAGAGAVLATGAAKWGLFGLSSVFHLSLFVYLYLIFPRSVPDEPRQIGMFNLLKNHIGLLWLAYPFVWLAGPAGLGYATLAGTAITFAFLDVMAKVPYVYFFYTRRSLFIDDGITKQEQASTAATQSPADD
jgi:sensory rhodopsin